MELTTQSRTHTYARLYVYVWLRVAKQWLAIINKICRRAPLRNRRPTEIWLKGLSFRGDHRGLYSVDDSNNNNNNE